MELSFINNPIRNAIVLYLICISVIIYIKPLMIYDSDNKLKVFGLSSKKTIFPLFLVSVVIAIVSYYFFSLLRIFL